MEEKQRTRESFLAYLEVLRQERSDRPTLRTMEILSGKWRIQLLYVLSQHESCRFGELRRAVSGITPTMLTSSLRELEQQGIIRKERFNEVPPRVEYSLTPAGEDLLPVFYEIARWSKRHLPENNNRPTEP